jgi:hypothetical protein
VPELHEYAVRAPQLLPHVETGTASDMGTGNTATTAQSFSVNPATPDDANLSSWLRWKGSVSSLLRRSRRQGACKVMIVRGLLTLVLVRGVGLTDCRRGPGFALRYGRVVMALG